MEVKLYRKRCQLTKGRADALYRVLGAHQMELVQQGVDQWQVPMPRLRSTSSANGKPITPAIASLPACEKYCREQRELLRAMEDLAQQEREMYELDNRKDQIMTVCKMVLANLGMWVRGHYFPASYAHAGWHRLRVFFQVPGRIFWGRDTVEVELKRFNDCALNRDLEMVCAKVAQEQPCLPDGRRLLFRVQGAGILRLDAQEQAVA